MFARFQCVERHLGMETAGYADGDGIDVVADSLGARRRIGALPHSAGLYPHLTARENIEFVMEVQGVSASERRARYLEVLEEGPPPVGPHGVVAETDGVREE